MWEGFYLQTDIIRQKPSSKDARSLYYPSDSGRRNKRLGILFLTDEEEQALEQQGKIIELRAYNTVHGLWKYFTVNDHQLDLTNHHYLIIGTLEFYLRLQEYFGAEFLIPIYVELESGERLQRALNREQLQTEPKYAELCRRFLFPCEPVFSTLQLRQKSR